MKFLVLATVIGALASSLQIGCSSRDKKQPETARQSLPKEVVNDLSLAKLEQAALAFKVAHEHSNESWQGPVDQAVPGCSISGKEAETGLELLQPWLQAKAEEEAKKLLRDLGTYRLGFDAETCDRDCSCSVGLRVLAAADLESLSRTKAKPLKQLRVQLEAKSELISRERAELCVDGVTWLCQSDLLRAVRAATKK